MEPGTTVYLPVNVPGGLLSMGDLGTAEPTWVSLEAAGQATLRIGVESGHVPAVPAAAPGRGEIFFLGIAESYPEAHALALDQAHDHLMSERGMDALDAFAYASAPVTRLKLGRPMASTDSPAASRS